MNSQAKQLYHEVMERVELHQVTLTVRDQVDAIQAIRDQLTRKLKELRQKETDLRSQCRVF